MSESQSGARALADVKLSISGMTCDGCASAVKRVLSRVPGTMTVEVDLVSGAASVAGTADAPALVAAVVAAGYEAKLA